ncbi:hypothetical protein P153DRAFT_356391 [Dothidotthia symphoricarpi CBS 119687]|uniref:Uncharacterized protein n=1 Tax=Dothidotthia symphoricarpi CBS 119687 TaxID=1392245 RepID=A0A6A6AHD5_9PLEO|nr:uncharacterized protein P153DRAFT_356391 [Dothidotthia symphoricarpi CBS 119687]KAF2130663.1 hypothetical protein P153DRAFT_356391 [Dothidotthia symphoricarpi CBS 119687]
MFPPPEDKFDTLHGEYRYEMNGSPSQMSDEVVRTIINTIRELSKDHMYVAVAGIRVHNMDVTPPLWPVRTGRATKLYAFSQHFDEFPVATEVSILWWDRNGRHFRLMDLPMEICSTIFRHILGENIYPVAPYDSTRRAYQVLLGLKEVNIPEAEDAGARPDAPNYAILGVNKQVRREAVCAGWEGTRKQFTAVHMLERVLSTTATPCSYNWLNRVHLNFSIGGLFHFFGVEIDPVVHITAARSMGHLLQGVDTLKHLELFFRSPYESGSSDGNPWSEYYRANHWRQWFTESAVFQSMAEHPC